MFIYQILFKIYGKITGPYVYKSNALQDIRQTHWSKKCRSLWPTYILWSYFGPYWLIYHNYDVCISNTLQDMRQNYWAMKCRSPWGHTDRIQQYDIFTSNTLNDIRQNLWTLKYRSLWPTFILSSNLRSYWLVIRKYGVYTWNNHKDVTRNCRTVKTLRDIRQNYWKYRLYREK